jgi:hypothetical protein
MTADTSRLKPIAIRVLVIVAIIAGGVVLVQRVFGCSPPRDQAHMIDLFKADPVFAAAPADGQLVDEYAHTYECDSGHGNSSMSPGFAEVRRLYKTPDVYNSEQLHQLFDQPAAMAGWQQLPPPRDLVANGGGDIEYCKETGGRAAVAYLTSSKGQDDLSRQLSPGVAVLISAFPQDGSTCDSLP